MSDLSKRTAKRVVERIVCFLYYQCCSKGRVVDSVVVFGKQMVERDSASSLALMTGAE